MAARVFTALLIGATQVCACSEPEATVPADFAVTLIRTGCMGHCPTYRVSLAADGTANLEAQQHVKPGSPSSWVLSQEQRQALLKRIRQGPFLALTQKRLDATCAEQWSDNPSSSVSTVLDGSSHKLGFYYGCRPSWWALRDRALVDGFKTLVDDVDALIGTAAIACDDTCTEGLY